jgi:hypothetical protein
MAGLSGNRILVGAIFFAPVRICPGAQPASYTMGTGSLTGIRRPGRGVNHPTPPSAEVTETVELHLYSPSRECDSVFISYSLHVCYMPYAYAPGLVGRMNYVANNCWKMRCNITDTMQSNEKKKQMQMGATWDQVTELQEQRHSYQDKGKNTPEKKATHKFSTIHYHQINYEMLSLYVLSVPSFLLYLCWIITWHK